MELWGIPANSKVLHGLATNDLFPEFQFVYRRLKQTSCEAAKASVGVTRGRILPLFLFLLGKPCYDFYFL